LLELFLRHSGYWAAGHWQCPPHKWWGECGWHLGVSPGGLHQLSHLTLAAPHPYAAFQAPLARVHKPSTCTPAQ